MRLITCFLTILCLNVTANILHAAPPNVVLILMDDMGWRDVGFAGNDFVETPNLDRLASEGIRFTQAYASAPNCAPTRACLMSGQYTPRHGVFTVIDPRHDPGQPHHKVISAKKQRSTER
jgi:arylsulfatase A